MSPFQTVTFRTARGYKFHVTCLYDITRALAMAWPDKERESYREAARLAGEAAEGWCTHRAAYDAFVAAASEQGRVVTPRKLCDRVAQELAAVEPENFNPQPAPYLARMRTRSTRQNLMRPNKPHI